MEETRLIVNSVKDELQYVKEEVIKPFSDPNEVNILEGALAGAITETRPCCCPCYCLC